MTEDEEEKACLPASLAQKYAVFFFLKVPGG